MGEMGSQVFREVRGRTTARTSERTYPTLNALHASERYDMTERNSTSFDRKRK